MVRISSNAGLARCAYRLRACIEFVHGFGFGERIKTIDSVVRAGKIRIVQGTIQLWEEDVSTYRIELGDDLLVKKATINVDAAVADEDCDSSANGR